MPGKSIIRAAARAAAATLCSKGIVFLPLIILFAVSCVTQRPVAEKPSGFAEFSATTDYGAISPEGVALRIRSIENEPLQTLEFWSEALKVHLLKSGYALLSEDGFSAPVGEGTYFEWIAPVEGEDWVFLTALAVSDSDIILAEAAGEYQLYQEYRDALMESISTIRLEKN